jgi:hypothetical protein
VGSSARQSVLVVATQERHPLFAGFMASVSAFPEFDIILKELSRAPCCYLESQLYAVQRVYVGSRNGRPTKGSKCHWSRLAYVLVING